MGQLTSLTYPSGRVVNTTYDNNARISQVTNPSNNVNYASSIVYAANPTFAVRHI
jgi:YD repeat-containing protein